MALCDVDHAYAAETFKKYPQAKVYSDYREMLDKEKGIDAVMIATPDHTHAVIAMEAMRRGKHVYCQKPLTHDVYEARMLAKAARETGVTTQMGIQGHSGEGGPADLRMDRATAPSARCARSMPGAVCRTIPSATRTGAPSGAAGPRTRRRSRRR